MAETQAVPEGRPNPSQTELVSEEAADALDATHVPKFPRFGRFRTLERLGAGAMGTVYRAHDDVLGRPVAIKALHLQGDVAIRERFLREARAIGAVAHPNILSIYDAGAEGETPYLVMELAGGPLSDRMKAGPLPAEAVRGVGIQIGRALAAAHAAGIVHRDVKPANILSGQGEAWKLADFGIARVPDSTLTVGGQFLGSPAYAAPESLRAGVFSPASDVYGLGATLYEALTGAAPRGDGDLRSVFQKLDQDPAPLHARPAVPRWLSDPIMAALARDPATRPPAEELARLLSSSGSAVKPAAIWAAWPRRRKLAVAGLVAGVLATLGALALSAANRSSAEPAAASTSSAVPERPGVSANPHSLEENRAPDESEKPIYVDQYGNRIDEETARQILQQLEQVGEGQYEWRGGVPNKERGRGRWKRE